MSALSSLRRVQEEFSHPVESLALTVDEVINVRRVLVKAEMEKFLQSKELYSNLKKGKVTNGVDAGLFAAYHQAVCHASVCVCVFQICCCCRVRFPLFSWPSTCLLCKRWEDKRPHVSWNVRCFKTLTGRIFCCSNTDTSSSIELKTEEAMHWMTFWLLFHDLPILHCVIGEYLLVLLQLTDMVAKSVKINSN